MRKIRHYLTNMGSLIFLGGMLIGLWFLVESLEMNTPVSQTQAPLNAPELIYRAPNEVLAATPSGPSSVDLTADQAAYPPPNTPEPTPLPTEEVPPTPPVLSPESLPGPTGRVATLFKGDIWLLYPDGGMNSLTDFADLVALFGWNHTGTKLLFGRGRFSHPDFFGDTTDLWVLDIETGETQRLSHNGEVQSVSWSPVDDRIAFCGYGRRLTVIDTEGEQLHRLESAICGFTWAPDGSAIAVPTFTADMVAEDGLTATVLGIWWLEDDRLQTFSDTDDEVHAWPIWSVDGQQILFQRDYFDPPEQVLSGVEVLEVENGQFTRLEGVSASVQEMSRSPRADVVVYRQGPDVYVMDFDGQIDWVGVGRAPLWLADGSTILVQTAEGETQLIPIEVEVVPTFRGGGLPSPSVYPHANFFISPGG